MSHLELLRKGTFSVPERITWSQSIQSAATFFFYQKIVFLMVKISLKNSNRADFHMLQMCIIIKSYNSYCIILKHWINWIDAESYFLSDFVTYWVNGSVFCYIFLAIIPLYFESNIIEFDKVHKASTSLGIYAIEYNVCCVR